MKLKIKEEKYFVVQFDSPQFQESSNQWNQGHLNIICNNMLIFQNQVIC